METRQRLSLPRPGGLCSAERDTAEQENHKRQYYPQQQRVPLCEGPIVGPGLILRVGLLRSSRSLGCILHPYHKELAKIVAGRAQPRIAVVQGVLAGTGFKAQVA